MGLRKWNRCNLLDIILCRNVKIGNIRKLEIVKVEKEPLEWIFYLGYDNCCPCCQIACMVDEGGEGHQVVC